MGDTVESVPVVRDFFNGTRPDWGQWAFTESLDCGGAVLRYPRAGNMMFEMHRGFEVGIVLSGEFERQCSGRSRRLSSGHVWLVPMWEPHGGRVVRPGTCVAVLFLPGFLGGERIGRLSWLSFFAVPPEDRPQAGTPQVRRETLGIADRICREVREQPAGLETGLRLALLQLLLVLYRRWDTTGLEQRQLLPLAGVLPRILPALQLAQERHGIRLHLSEAAAACGFSISHFKRVFRQAMGLSFGQFCLRARLALVANQLVATDQSERLIAEQTGFEDASHLHRSFVKHFGTTPGRYRRRLGLSGAGPSRPAARSAAPM